MGYNDDEHYDNPVYEISTKFPDTDYFKLMQSLNRKQSEIYTHIIQHKGTTQEQMFIFLEGGAGVGKVQCAKVIYESVKRYFGCKPGEDANIITTQQLVPTGMAAYLIGGNTVHSGLHININQKTLVPLSASVLNTL